MRSIVIVLILLMSWSNMIGSPKTQDQQRYLYHVWGTVLNEQSEPMPNVSVWFIPSERPLAGRLAHTLTDREGNFALTAKDIPDKYTVCASKTDSPFVPIQKEPADKSSATEDTVTCGKPISFGPEDECRKVDLKFQPGK